MMNPSDVRDISVEVYKRRLVAECGKGAVERVLASDGDGGKKLRNRAASYDALTRCYLDVLLPILTPTEEPA